MAVYSHSRLSTFENCRLRYRLKYVDRVKRALEGIEAFLGSRVHDALEALYRDVLMGRTPSVDDVLASYARKWDDAWHDGIAVVNDEYDIGDYRAVGEQCIRRYHARWAPFRQDQTLGVEIRVMLELPGGAKLQGFIDRVARDPDGWLVIHDYKTSQRLPAQEEIDRDRQLALYHAGVDRKWPGAPGVRLVWHFLRFDEVLTSTRTREQITSLLKETGRLIHHVESETDWTPNVTNLCNWCPYWDLCPEKKHQWALEHPGDPEPTLLPSPVPEAEAADRALKDAMDPCHGCHPRRNPRRVGNHHDG
ncbi:MAG: RecB family exonuclease [Planctomycetota bacterium]|jgi:putative RecB family exonuclease